MRNRLAGYSDVADRFDMSLSYNGRGERVARAVNRTGMPGELDGFYYNESGQLLGRQRGDEKSGGTVINEEIVWLDQTPVARVWVEDGSIAQVHAIHSDHLDTPRALANAQAQANQAGGTIVWRWKLNQQTPTGSNAFGAQSATEDPDNNGTLIKFDLRFPGQQYDAATGLHYNYFRDYEAGTGRYVESDPVGLRGGHSTYGYALASPLRRADARGLFVHNPGHEPDNTTGGRPVCNGVMLTYELYWQEPCTEDGANIHELSHVNDIRLRAPGLCHDNATNEVRPIDASGMPEKILTERNAYARESACLRAKLDDMGCDDACREKILRRLEFVDEIISTMSYPEF